MNLKNNLNKWLDKVLGYTLKGVLFCIPFGITAFVVLSITNWVISKSAIFLFYVPQAEINHHKIWYVIAVLTSIALLAIVGYILETQVGSKTEKWIDKKMSEVKGIGGIYSMSNKITEWNKKNGDGNLGTGKTVVMPFLNEMMLQVGYITNNEKIMEYNPFYRKAVDHYVVNFPPAFALMGGSAVLVPVDLITEYEDKFVWKISIDQAFQFNVSGGSVVPNEAIIKQ